MILVINLIRNINLNPDHSGKYSGMIRLIPSKIIFLPKNDFQVVLYQADINHAAYFQIDSNANDSSISLRSVSGASNVAHLYIASDTGGAEYVRVSGASFHPTTDSTTTLGLAANCFLDVFSDVLTIHEVGSSPTPVSDYGKLYTKSDNLLYFCDGGGTEYTVDITGV